MMGIEFPSSHIAGQKVGRWKSNGAEWESNDDFTSLFKNMLINSAMDISQQWGNGSPAQATTGNTWAADQWQAGWLITGGSLTAHRYQPVIGEGGGGPYPASAVVIYNSAVAAGGGAGDHTHIYQRIEGNRCSDLKWGTPEARPAVLRFMFMSAFPGTYTVAIQNGSQTRSYCALFTVKASQIWEEFVLAIPPDTEGVWPIDNTAGLLISWGGAWGSNYAGVPGWQAGSKYAAGPTINWVAQGNGYIRLARVGFYVDPFGTGVAPLWVHPQYAEEEIKCLRYLWKFNGGLCGGWVSATQGYRMGVNLPTNMRVPPAFSYVGTQNTYSGAAGGVLNGVTATYSSNDHLEVDITSTGTFTAGHCARVYIANPTTTYMYANSRM